MNHIDKTKNEELAKNIVNRLLDDCWDGNQYHGADYEGLCKTEYKESFIDILLDDQNGTCCYCMKSITNDHTTTLEHIAPHKCNLQEFINYRSTEIVENVIHRLSFNYTIQSIPPHAYPHDIAYHNLVGSCNSISHCNHYRSNKRIKELFYDNNIANKVEYDTHGYVFSYEYSDELDAIGISTDAELILFRKLWAFFAQTKDAAADVSDEDIEEKILELVAEDGDEKLLDDMFGKPSKKEDFKKYNWFYDYYTQKN